MSYAMLPRPHSSMPVAVTMMSASSVSPDLSRMPFSTKRSMWSVAIDALPEEMAWNRSPSGSRQSLSFHGP